MFMLKHRALLAGAITSIFVLGSSQKTLAATPASKPTALPTRRKMARHA